MTVEVMKLIGAVIALCYAVYLLPSFARRITVVLLFLSFTAIFIVAKTAPHYLQTLIEIMPGA